MQIGITALYAGLLGILFLFLSVNVIRTRGQTGVGLGDGGNELLARRIRAHGNFVDYVPFVLVAMVILEISATPPWLLHGLGIVLAIGRSLHAIALSGLKKRPAMRTGGMILTLAALVVASLACVRLGVDGLLAATPSG